MIIKLVNIAVIFFLATTAIGNNECRIEKEISFPQAELLYDNIWGTIYHAVTEQCDETPHITGDGSKINPRKASEYRWIAISQDMLNDTFRLNLLKYPNRTNLFKGKIQYGDTIWIESPYDEINGWWVVRDTKNKRYSNSIDFLQTTGDATLYNDDKFWSGKFDSIKIYKVLYANYSEFKNDLEL